MKIGTSELFANLLGKLHRIGFGQKHGIKSH